MAHSRHPSGCAAHSLSRFARLSGSSSKVGCRRWVRTIIAGSKIRSPACWTTRQKKCPRQELHLRPQGPQPCVLSAELRGRNWSHRQDLHPAPAHTKGAHRFLCFGGKLRHAGDAPAHPRWQRGVLLIDECRDKWSGGKVLPPRELGVGQPCYCYITAGCSNWPLELELRQPLGLFRPAHISLCHPAKKLRAGGVAPPLFTQRAWFYRPGRHIWQSPRTLVESWSRTWDLHPPCGLHRPECELATLSPGKWSGTPVTLRVYPLTMSLPVPPRLCFAP